MTIELGLFSRHRDKKVKSARSTAIATTVAQSVSTGARLKKPTRRRFRLGAGGFAAPLLSITGCQSFGIHLFGHSKAGKSMALLAGASVIGLGHEEDFRPF